MQLGLSPKQDVVYRRPKETDIFTFPPQKMIHSRYNLQIYQKWNCVKGRCSALRSETDKHDFMPRSKPLNISSLNIKLCW